MRHVLMDPAFPDLVSEWAGTEESASQNCDCANDNGEEPASDLADPLLTAFAKAEIAATRLW